jgi:hypothetical protein
MHRDRDGKPDGIQPGDAIPVLSRTPATLNALLRRAARMSTPEGFAYPNPVPFPFPDPPKEPEPKFPEPDPDPEKVPSGGFPHPVRERVEPRGPDVIDPGLEPLQA